MGTMTWSVVEVFNGEEWQVSDEYIFPGKYESSDKQSTPFSFQDSAIASFIAGVRNDYEIQPMAKGRGLPDGHECIPVIEGFAGMEVMHSRYPYEIVDTEMWYGAKTWVLLSELVEFDYDATFEDRRNDGPGPETVDVGQGTIRTYREHLGPFYFEVLDVLQTMGAPEQVRIVFAFSS